MEFLVVIDNNNNNDDNSIIFFKIWRNKFINQQIFNHLKLYSYNLYPRIFNNVESIINFKQKEYLNSIHLISFQHLYSKDILDTNDDNDDYDDDLSTSSSDSDTEFSYHNNLNNYIDKDNLYNKIKNNCNSNNNEVGFNTNLKPIPVGFKEVNKIKRANNKILLLSPNVGSNMTKRRNSLEIYKKKTTTTTTTPTTTANNNNNNNYCSLKRRSSLKIVPTSSESEGEIESSGSDYGFNKVKVIKYPIGDSDSSSDSETASIESKESEIEVDDGEFQDFIYNRFSETDILKSILPPSVKNIFIDFRNKSNSVKVLFDQYKTQQIPESITNLKIGNSLSFSIKDYFSSGSGSVGCFSNLKILELGNSFNEAIPVNTLPISLTKLSIGNRFNKQLLVGSLPSNLEHLYIGTSFNLEFQKNVLPVSLLSLTCLCYNKLLKPNVIPYNLKFISLPKFSLNLNQGVLPNSLETLLLGSERLGFIQIGALPFNLKKLIIFGYWNQKIEPYLLPHSLTHLELPKYVKRPRNLPNNLKYLNIAFDKSLSDNLIGSIKKKFSDKRTTTNGFIPNNLETLIMYRFFSNTINQGNLPLSLTSLTVSLYYDHTLKANSLPPNIKKLKFHSFNNGGQPLKRECLPLKLEELEFTLAFNQKIESLPNECFRVLKLGNAFNQPIKRGVLPDTIRLVELSCSTFDKEIHLPNQSLTTLKFSSNSGFYLSYPSKPLSQFLNSSITEFENGSRNQLSINTIPLSCKSVLLANSFNNPIPDVFPISITSIIFTGSITSNDPFSKGCLLKLNNLLNLELPSTFNRELLASQLPNSIKTLTIGKSYYKEISTEAFPSLEILTIKGNGCPIIKDPTLFKHLKTINVNYSNINFLDSIDQLKFLNFISLHKE